MFRPFCLLLVVLSAACGPRTIGNCTGADELEDALAFAVKEDPALADFADGVEVFCVTREKIRAASRCRVDTPSCLMWPGNGWRAGRVYVVEGEDVSQAMCHEAQHARPVVWQTADGCQSHKMSCNFDQLSVDRCARHVRALRSSSGG